MKFVCFLFVLIPTLFTDNFITMSKLRLTAIRQNEDWILNDEPTVYIHGQITQYLLSHQISGIRFVYDNYKKVRFI